jgi:hypothetical protein
VTIDAGAGRVGCKRPDGSNIQPGDMPAGGIVDLVFDGTFFQMVNYLGGASTGSITNVYTAIPYAVDSSTTPNIVTAAFTPTVTDIHAGFICLIKIANANTADTIVNIDTIKNQPVRANSGDRLLPGDIMTDDIKIFIFDGTNFYIAPNNLLPTSVTINVPTTQFPDIATTINALSRKSIAATATVTIQVAQGKFSGMSQFYHRDAYLIVIQGTMLAAPPPIDGGFYMSGGDAGSRASDAINNLAMLRSRYGTEISVPSNQDGFGLNGSGRVTLKDLLIVGADKGATVGVSSGTGIPTGAVYCDNVAVWGCAFGFRTGNKMTLHGGSAVNCAGGLDIEGGEINATNFVSTGNDSYGAACIIGGVLGCVGCRVRCNGYMGIFANLQGVINVYGSVIMQNYYWDSYAYQASSIALISTTIYTMTPSPGTIGNFNSTCLGQ